MAGFDKARAGAIERAARCNAGERFGKEISLLSSQYWQFIFCGALIAVLAAAVTPAGILQAWAQTSRVPRIVAVCAPCHGADGTTGDVEKPNLAGQKGIYLRQQLLAFRAGKRKHPDMKTISRRLTDREIDQLVLYYSTLVP
jgi:cytochrome c553